MYVIYSTADSVCVRVSQMQMWFPGDNNSRDKIQFVFGVHIEHKFEDDEFFLNTFTSGEYYFLPSPAKTIADVKFAAIYNTSIVNFRQSIDAFVNRNKI